MIEMFSIKIVCKKCGSNKCLVGAYEDCMRYDGEQAAMYFECKDCGNYTDTPDDEIETKHVNRKQHLNTNQPT